MLSSIHNIDTLAVVAIHVETRRLEHIKFDSQVSSLKCFVGRGNATSASSSSAAKLPLTEEGRAHHEATQDRARPDFRIEECGTRNGRTDAAVSLSPALINTLYCFSSIRVGTSSVS